MARQNLLYLDFGHRKLNKKSRVFRHEISHLTLDLLSIVRKINRNLAVCEGAIKIFGSKKQSFRAIFPTISNENDFHELLYNIENFIFRLHAYKDKMCIFINFVMRLGYSDSDLGLVKKLLNHEIVKRYHLDTELKKFSLGEFSELSKTRKSMSHRIYYERYNPLFMPEENPKDVGYYKAALAWKRKVIKEVNGINNCMENIFEINKRVSEKLLNFLNV